MQKFIGINNISVSEVDGICYITDKTSVMDGYKHSLCYYPKDGSVVSDTDDKLFLYPESNQFVVNTNMLVKEEVNFANTVTLSGKASCNSLLVQNNLAVSGVLDVSGITFFKGLKTTFLRSTLFTDKVSVSGKLNLTERTIESTIGSIGDTKGDVAIDKNYLYYCTGDYDGTNDIWVRWACDSKW